MPICPDCKSSELVQSANPEYMTCTVCKALFKLFPISKAKASTLNAVATSSHSLLPEGPNISNIADVAVTKETQANPRLHRNVAEATYKPSKTGGYGKNEPG